MQSSQQLRYAGDVSIDKVQIVTSAGFYQDITAQVINIQFYEDIFSPFISGSLIIKESLDLVNLFPFVGEEFVDLEITTPTLENTKIKGRYYIYKLSDRELVGDRNVVYQLHFISVEALVDINKKVSKVYVGNVSKLVKEFITDKVNGMQSTKDVVVEDTIKDAKFIANFWSPVKCINYLTDYAVNKNSTPNYVFFENRDGFYFVSLDALYKNGVKQEFVYDKYTRENLESKGASTRSTEEDYKRITNISIPVGFDYMDRIRSGAFSSKVISWDLTRKQYNSKMYTMFDRFDKQEHLNKYALASNRAIFKSNSALINLPRQTQVFGGFGDPSNYKILQERLSLMKLAEGSKIEITVPGRTDYTVGQKVNVKLYKIEPVSKDDTDNEDKMFSGNYIIAAINHYIDREMHECHMELIKDSLKINLDGNK